MAAAARDPLVERARPREFFDRRVAAVPEARLPPERLAQRLSRCRAVRGAAGQPVRLDRRDLERRLRRAEAGLLTAWKETEMSASYRKQDTHRSRALRALLPLLGLWLVPS